ncbi:hypothetical protein ACOSQ3_026221 [Xanthoceras sorbifolium]
MHFTNMCGYFSLFNKNIVHFLPEIRVDRAGEATSLTGKNFPFLEEIGLSCSLVKLEADAMLSPFYTNDSLVRVFYAVKGTGNVQIVGINGKLVLDNQILACQVFVVPRFFTVGVIAEDEGLECFSVTTTSRIPKEDKNINSVLKLITNNRSPWAASSQTRSFY